MFKNKASMSSNITCNRVCTIDVVWLAVKTGPNSYCTIYYTFTSFTFGIYKCALCELQSGNVKLMKLSMKHLKFDFIGKPNT